MSEVFLALFAGGLSETSPSLAQPGVELVKGRRRVDAASSDEDLRENQDQKPGER